MKEERIYDALFFKQPGNKEYILSTFVVGVSDLIDWVGIPRKKVKDTSQILFQRALEEQRLEKIKKHFNSCVSPNSILLTLREGTVNNISEITNKVNCSTGPIVGKLEIDTTSTFGDLREKLEKVIHIIEERISISDISEGVEANFENVEESEGLLENDVIVDVHSHLGETLNFLKNFYNRYVNEEVILDNDIKEMEDFCTDYLKPAFLVDGQHRTFGAYEKILEELANGNEDYEILIPVSAIINSDWKESVFQFVIINQTAQKIDNKFLSSIISTSLSDEELLHFREQLETSGAPVNEALIINQLYTINFERNGKNINPFFGNIEFAVPEEGDTVLRYSTVKSLLNKIRNFTDGNTAVFGKPYENLKKVILKLEISEEEWKEKYWSQFLIYFWHLSEKHFTSIEKLEYLPLSVKESKLTGSNLSLKISMQFLQDHFVSYITRNQQLLSMSKINLKIKDNTLDFEAFAEIFKLWCDHHNKNYAFFESEWKGLSSYKREADKYEGINNAWEMDQSGRSKLFRG